MIRTFNSLLGTDLDQLCATKSDTTDVGKDIVGDDQADRQEEPDHAFKDVVHDKVRLHDNQVESHVSPGELSELELVVTLLKRTDEEDEAWVMLVLVRIMCLLPCSRKLTHDVEHKRDKSVVCRERQKNLVHQDDVLEVVDHTLAVQEVHGGSEEVPVESLCEAQTARPRRHICNRNDLLVANNLHGGHNDEHIDVAREHRSEEEGDHDKSPDRACNESLLLLLVFRQLLDRRLLVVGRPASRGVCAVLLVGVAISRRALGVVAVWAREAALFCGRVGHAASTHATIAVLELDVLFGLGHGCGMVGGTVETAARVDFFRGRLVSFRLRTSCGARLGMGYAEAAG